ncbi:putative von Willebrand factor, type A, von Willebrand factor A-like domain superfamily [Helianthus debilis subsp. tardiflorus]
MLISKFVNQKTNAYFPCIVGYVKEKGSLACPVCGTMRKETPVFSVADRNQKLAEEDKMRENDDVVDKKSKLNKQNSFRPDLKVYNDDEPICLLTPKGGFNPIPESVESFDEDSIDEFEGFDINNNNNNCSNNSPVQSHAKEVDVRLLPEAAVISASRGYETYAICLRAKAPPMRTKTEPRAPIDLVTVIDVSGKMTNEKLQMMKRTMRMIISSLSSSDRLSIVAFSSYSKRLL